MMRWKWIVCFGFPVTEPGGGGGKAEYGRPRGMTTVRGYFLSFNHDRQVPHTQPCTQRTLARSSTLSASHTTRRNGSRTQVSIKGPPLAIHSYLHVDDHVIACSRNCGIQILSEWSPEQQIS